MNSHSFQQLSSLRRTTYRIVTITVILVSALILCTAGFYNRYPLLYPDSFEYIDAGEHIWNALRSGTPGYFGQRSPFYSLFVYLLYQHHSLWFVILGQSLIMSYLIWLSFKQILPTFDDLHFPLIIILLTLFTSVSWYTSFLMPDIFAAVLILGIFNLGFDDSTISTFQYAILAAIVILAITVHTSHLMLIPMLLIGVIVIHLKIQTPLRIWRTVSIRLLTTIVTSIALMLTSTYFLYGKFGLVGPHPPFLLARIISDGPGKIYLKEHCVRHDYAVCKYINVLPKYFGPLLWGPKSIMKLASKEDTQRIREEELQVVLGAVRTYPWKQLKASAKNFVKQCLMIGPNYFTRSIDSNAIDFFPIIGTKHFRSRQYLKTLPPRFLRILQCITVLVAIFICFFIVLRLGKLLPNKLFALTVLIVIGLLGNNLITGAISQPNGRFQSRIIWLVPMLSILFVFVWAYNKQKNQGDR